MSHLNRRKNIKIIVEQYHRGSYNCYTYVEGFADARGKPLFKLDSKGSEIDPGFSKYCLIYHSSQKNALVFDSYMLTNTGIKIILYGARFDAGVFTKFERNILSSEGRYYILDLDQKDLKCYDITDIFDGFRSLAVQMRDLDELLQLTKEEKKQIDKKITEASELARLEIKRRLK